MAFRAPVLLRQLAALRMGVRMQRPAPVARFFSVSRLNREKFYTETHEWVEVEDGVATVGITKHAAEALGDVVYIEMPAVGDELAPNDPFGSVESVKSVSDLHSPVAGKVLELNQQVSEKPGLISRSAEEEGWIIKVDGLNFEADKKELMTEEQYLATL